MLNPEPEEAEVDPSLRRLLGQQLHADLLGASDHARGGCAGAAFELSQTQPHVRISVPGTGTCAAPKKRALDSLYKDECLGTEAWKLTVAWWCWIQFESFSKLPILQARCEGLLRPA